MSGGEGPERAARVTHPTVAGDDARPRRRAGGRGIKFRVPIAAPPAAAGAIAEKENRPAPHSSRAGCRPDTPGLTEQRETPHAAATCGVLTGLAGSRPPGPGAPNNLAWCGGEFNPEGLGSRVWGLGVRMSPPDPRPQTLDPL